MSTDIKLKALKEAEKFYNFVIKKQWIKLSDFTYQGGASAMNLGNHYHSTPW